MLRKGKLLLVEHLPHDFADRTGRTDHCNADSHGTCPFSREWRLLARSIIVMAGPGIGK